MIEGSAAAELLDHTAAAERARQRVHTDFVELFLAYWKSSLVGLAMIIAVVALTGHTIAPGRYWGAWGGIAFATCLGQATASLAMERSKSLEEGIRRWMPWLLASIALSGVAWGLLPWLVFDAPAPILLFACLFVAMLLFCIANSPGPPAMTVIGVPPIAVLGTPALMFHPGLQVAGVGFLLLVTVIGFYGLRLRKALGIGLTQRHLAEDLASELRDHQSRLLQLERERTLAVERERLTRDMHDGLGSALVAALGTVTVGDIDRDHLTTVLTDCVDDLRAVIDSLEPVDCDLVALLAMTRPRSERRLKDLGATLSWEMGDLPKLDWLGPSEALNVLRIMQELLNNVAKHSGARHVAISAASVGGTVEVRVEDDGCGFAPQHVPTGRGQSFIRHRAAAIGSEVRIESELGHGAAATLTLPVTR